MKTRRAAWVGLAWLAAVATLAAADEIRVTPLVVGETRVLASFGASTAFSDDTEAVMMSGLLLTFTYDVEVRRPAALWFDSTLGSTTVTASVKHDNLTGSFQVSKTQEGQVVWSEQTDDEAQVRTWMTEFEKIPIGLANALEPNADYYLQVRLHKNPRPRFSLLPPWGRNDGSGRADFPYIQ